MSIQLPVVTMKSVAVAVFVCVRNKDHGDMMVIVLIVVMVSQA